MPFAVGRLKVSKGDLYGIKIEREFSTIEEAKAFFEKSYGNKAGNGEIEFLG